MLIFFNFDDWCSKVSGGNSRQHIKNIISKKDILIGLEQL